MGRIGIKTNVAAATINVTGVMPIEEIDQDTPDTGSPAKRARSGLSQSSSGSIPLAQRDSDSDE